MASVAAVVTFESPSGDGSRMTLAETMRDGGRDPEASAHGVFLGMRLGRSIGRALTALPEVEAEIYRRRRLKDEPDSIDAVCADLALSRDRARMLEERAAKRVRQALDGEGYRRELAA
jgi:DNA-directed RNA polymerase sigma subunit (sigma70/sigma32)